MANYITTIREKMNCSARDFAYFLRTSRQNLARVETGRGHFPFFTDIDSAAMFVGDTILELDKELKLNGPPADDFLQAWKTDLESRNNEIDQAITKLRKNQGLMSPRYDKARMAYLYCTKLVSKSGKVDATRSMWLDGQLKVQFKMKEKNNDAARHQLQVRIAQLEVEKSMNLSVILDKLHEVR